jgi:hypothetical protein
MVGLRQGAGTADLIEGQGSDKAQMSSTSAKWVMQAICTESWVAGAVKARGYWCMFTHL